MRRMLWLALVLGGCDRSVSLEDTSPTPPSETDVPTTDTAPEWPLWVYQFVVQPETSELGAGPLVRVDGYGWSGSYGGPTIVADVDHEVTYTVTNNTALELAFTFPGVEVIQPMVVPVAGGGAVTYRTSQGPGVHVYKVASTDDDLARRGMFGLLTVRDPAAFPVDALEKQSNLVLVDLPLAYTEVDACLTGAADTAGPCPSWVPADEAFGTALVAQRILVNPLQRHGGPPNEFQTTTVDALYYTAGDDVRVNLASLGDEPHTLSLGGLTWKDPLSGEPRDTLVLEPGQGTHVVLEAVGPVGGYEVRCLDHDHHGLDAVVIHVEE